MIKAMFAFGALTLVVAAPAAAQMALPKCSATVRDSCDQGANDPKAMSAAQAEASGGVGDRHSDQAAKSMAMAGKPKKHHKTMTKTTTTTDAAPADAPK